MLFSADITTVTVKAEMTLNEIRQFRTQCRKSAKRVIAKLFAIPLESPAPPHSLGSCAAHIACEWMRPKPVFLVHFGKETRFLFAEQTEFVLTYYLDTHGQFFRET